MHNIVNFKIYLDAKRNNTTPELELAWIEVTKIFAETIKERLENAKNPDRRY